MNLNEKSMVFTKQVKAIYIEISESCNRKCIFCPNHDEARYSTSAGKQVDKIIYSRLCEELGKIGYKGTLGFHLYNEPLINYDHFKNCLKTSRKLIPSAKLVLNTNGDFLNSERLREIFALGLSSMHVSLYAPRDGAEFSLEIAQTTITNMARKLDLELKQDLIKKSKDRVSFGASIAAGQIVNLVMENFNQQGVGYSSRMEDSSESLAGWQRKNSCSSPLEQILIDINGNYLPCCNIHTSHKAYGLLKLGNIYGDQSIVETYFNRNYEFWRKACSFSPPLFEICQKCSRGDQK